MIDMSRVTCADYLAMNAADSAGFSAWMSGWFNQKHGYVFVDLNAYQRNVANLKAWCASYPTQTVMAGRERRGHRQRTAGAGGVVWNLHLVLLSVFPPPPSLFRDKVRGGVAAFFSPGKTHYTPL